MDKHNAAAIRRGQRAAFRQLNTLDRDTLAELLQIYRAAQGQLLQRWGGMADVDGQIDRAYTNQVIDQLNQVIDHIAGLQEQLLVTAVESAALTGAGAVATSGVASAHMSAVQAVWQLEQADGLRLSDRLWKINEGAKAELGREIRLALARGDSPLKAGRDLLEKGSLANAQRVFRTEMARAHTLAYMDSVDDLPDVVGYKFNLSSNHRRTDICDLHAGANLYGLGRGVYPKAVISRIYPAHPNTTSYVTAVFAEEVGDAERVKDKNRIGWLGGQPAAVQAAVLGQYKAGLLRDGKLTERMINSKVSTLKKRFGDE